MLIPNIEFTTSRGVTLIHGLVELMLDSSRPNPVNYFQKTRRMWWESRPSQAVDCDAREVTLVVHCRKSIKICDSRLPLLNKYAQYFKAVKFLRSWPELEQHPLPTNTFRCNDKPGAGPGDPYMCLSQVFDASKDSAGLLYMHFDAVISPCTFAEHFDQAKVGLFDAKPQYRWHTYKEFDKCNVVPWKPWKGCFWRWWDAKGRHAKRRAFMNSMMGLKFQHQCMRA